MRQCVSRASASMALLILAIPMLAAPEPTSAPERPFGTEMTLTFIALEAGQTYSISFESGTSLTGQSRGAPAGVRLGADSLVYTPAADVPSVTFTVGGLIWTQDMTWKVQVPAPSALVVSIPRARIQHAVVAGGSQQLKLHTDVEAPDQCLIALDCTLNNLCPIVADRPLKCYGPIVSSFYCCWGDPY